MPPLTWVDDIVVLRADGGDLDPHKMAALDSGTCGCGGLGSTDLDEILELDLVTTFTPPPTGIQLAPLTSDGDRS